MIATIIETKTNICVNDAPNDNGLFLSTKTDVFICHKNGCVDLSIKWFGLICQRKWFGLFCQSLVGWAGVGLGLGPLVSFLLTSLSLSSSIKYIRRERIEDFVCSVLSCEMRMSNNNNERVLKVSSKVA